MITPEESPITRLDLDNLRHMVAADARNAGYRNHFAPGGEDIASMLRLEQAGLVIQGRPYEETHFYHATLLGCKAAGLSRAATRRALGEDR